MRHVALLVCVFLTIGGVAATEEPGSVSLSAGGGVAIPGGTHGGISEASFAWGFHVNIAVLDTLRISPSAEIYRISGVYATDLALAFHYVIPLEIFEVYFGVAPGLATWGTSASPLIGGLVGFIIPILDQIAGFTQFRYKVLSPGDTNIHFSHLSAGLLFSF